MFKTLMDFLGYEKKKPTPVRTETHNRQYRYVMTEDLETYQDTARLNGFELKVIKRTDTWVTLHLSPREIYLIQEHNLPLLR